LIVLSQNKSAGSGMAECPASSSFSILWVSSGIQQLEDALITEGQTQNLLPLRRQ
jgi:hypothetical protein